LLYYLAIIHVYTSRLKLYTSQALSIPPEKAGKPVILVLINPKQSLNSFKNEGLVVSDNIARETYKFKVIIIILD